MDTVAILPIVVAFLLGVATSNFYRLYRLHFRTRAIAQPSFKSPQANLPAAKSASVSVTATSTKSKSKTKTASTKTTATNVTTRSAAQLEGSLPFKETVDMLGKWAEEIEDAGEFKISLDMEKKRKFMGGLIAERVVVEGFRAQQKKVRFL
ncbi:hypothetical protein DL98DRAFT_589307 [Cadophora sp. DSE1049]|nr:hypothetical protein DL98DRAFT_589307 [Cadophora sp. DSE1049]